MDPWSSNEWVEPVDHAPSSKLKFDLDLQTSSENATFPSSQQTWPAPEFSLPSWDNPSPPKSNSPIVGTLPLDKSEKLETQSNGGTDLTAHSRPKQDHVVPSIQSLTIHTLPNSPTSSFRTARSASPETWADSTQSIPSDPAMRSHQFVAEPATAEVTSSNTPASTSADLGHPTSDPDDVRWGTFTQTDIIPISSSISFQPDPITNFSTSTESPTQSGWNGETNLSGWAGEVPAIDHSLPSFGISHPIPSQDDKEFDSNQIESGWSSPPLSDNNSCNQENRLEPAWDQSASHNVHQVSSDVPGTQQLEDEQWTYQGAEKPLDFLSSDKAAVSLDPSSTLSPGGELTRASTELSRDPLPDTSDTRAQHLFQNSSTSDAFQSAISKTAQVAANVLKSANKPGLFYAYGAQNSSASQNSFTPSTSSENPKGASEKVVWGDFSALEAPGSNPAISGEASVQQPSDQKPRGGFFRLWASKPSPLPKASESKSEGGSSILSPDTIGASPLTPQNSSHQSRGSVSSVSTSSTVWPAPSPVSDPSQTTTTSTMSRLFGRFGSRSQSATISNHIVDDQSAFTAPSTELDANEAKILDFFKTVPVEPQTLDDDNLPLGQNATKSNHKAKPSLDVFEFLSNNQGPPDLRRSVGSDQSSSSKLSSLPRGEDPFDFIRSSNFNKQSHSLLESTTSSSSRQFLSQLDSLSSSSIHPKNQLAVSGSKVGGHTTSGDDMDEIFSAFQGPGTSARAQAPTALYNDSGQVSNRLSTHKISSTKVIPKPLMNKALTSQATSQVRMTVNSSQPILRQNSDQIGTTSSKVPILPPPPSSSRGTVTNSIPRISHPQNKVPLLSPPAFSPGSKTTSPNPLIPTSPQNVIAPIQPISSNHSYSIPSPQNPPLSLSARTVSQQSFSSATHAPKNPHLPIQTGLSKEDLSFFDSLI